ncbi:hypothetical protein ACNUDN_24350 [Mycobacterium sp. smrl_JER01]|uniref:hypothetical protein n=1 Tax=Mycobacterium sp. smrl_JER01 TaxID=3402633 RepID=UPI003ABED6D5
MIVTGAFLAETASVVNNKLDVRGGVVDRFIARPDRIAMVTLVVLLQPQPFDQAPVVDVTISTPAGEPHRLVLDVPQNSLGGRIGFFCAPIRLPVPVDGDYVFSIATHQGSLSLPLSVTS